MEEAWENRLSMRVMHNSFLKVKSQRCNEEAWMWRVRKRRLAKGSRTPAQWSDRKTRSRGRIHYFPAQSAGQLIREIRGDQKPPWAVFLRLLMGLELDEVKQRHSGI